MVKASEETILLAEDRRESPSAKVPYPKSVFFIIGNEFCERFSYYGMKAILILFFTKIIRYEDDLATTVYHVFAMGCYFTPIFGAMLADSLLGKFKTIFYVSILYAAGNIVLSLSAIPKFLPTEIVAMIGLAMIALGTGGIKPCVSAFGGDQFAPSQEKELQWFFSFFYMSINFGGLFSTILTPYLREDVWCFGQNSCFSLAFGVPAILMVVALILFLLGRPLYVILAPKGNIVIQVLKCIGHAISNRPNKSAKTNATTTKVHWLDYASDQYDQQFINDIKDVLHVLFLYLPLPVFWALFDQQGSRWTLQAAAMDGDTLPWLRIKPDQMQVINPALIIIFIPLFEYCFYPLLAKCHLLTRPLQRITVGGILAASAFVVAAFVEIALEKTLPVMPCEGYSRVSVLNTLPCDINITGPLSNSIILQNEVAIFEKVKMNHSGTLDITAANCSNLENKHMQYSLRTNEEVEVIMAASIDNHLQLIKAKDDLIKPEKGETKFRAFFVPQLKPRNHTVVFLLEPIKDGAKKELQFNNFIYSDIALFTEYKQVPPIKYKMKIKSDNTTVLPGHIELKMGANYIMTIVPQGEDLNDYKWHLFVMVQPNSLSVFYQIPQYVLITAGEIMSSITGLEFSYSQAPQSMKSVLQAAWLLTVAFGNLIVVIVAQARMFSKQHHMMLVGHFFCLLYQPISFLILDINSIQKNITKGTSYHYYEFFMFAGLMIVDMILFAIMGYFYKYVERPNEDQELVHTSDTTDKGVENQAFSDISTKM